MMPKLTTPPTPNTLVVELWNLSDLTASWLNDIGIYTYDDLCNRDILEVWHILKIEHHQVSKLMYYALWGAVNNCHWNKIPASEKVKLA
jgi:DNA transformation protein and related proteins